MENKMSKILHYISSAIGIALVVCVFIQIFSVSKYNSTEHTVKSTDLDETVSVSMAGRSGDSASWPKSNLGLEGRIFDATFHNGTNDVVSSWELRIDIVRDCYISQAWNGEVEIHQYVDDPDHEEIVQTINLADYDKDELEVDYMIDGPDLMIPLYVGDYYIYHPSEEYNESPLAANSDVSVGFVIYYRRFMEFPTYYIDYYYQKNIMQGPLFMATAILAFSLLLTIAMNFSASYIYKKAKKEMDLRKSGLSCMMGLYSGIYIIDVKNNTIEPVGEAEDDNDRPKNSSAEEQLEYMFTTDPEEQYRPLLLKYTKLESVIKELEEKGRLVIEFESIKNGWCRVRFMLMDKQENRSANKILVTVHNVNDEKMQLDNVRHQAELIESESIERREIMEGIFKEAKTPVNTILTLNDKIMKTSNDDQIVGWSSEIKKVGGSFMSMVNNTLDYSYLESGKLEIIAKEYAFKDLASNIKDEVSALIEEKEIEYEVDISDEMPEKLYGDSARIKQVVVNIVSSITQELNKGNIVLRIYTGSRDENKVHMLFSVKEKGYGKVVSDEKMEMHVAKGIVSLMNSEIKTASVGEGCDYYFEIEQGLR